MRHKHADLIKQWVENKDLVIEWFNGEEWDVVKHPNFFEEYKYRIKPEEYVPYTFEDAKKLIGRNVVANDGSLYCTIVKVSQNFGVAIVTDKVVSLSYEDLLTDFRFLDGSKIGKRA